MSAAGDRSKSVKGQAVVARSVAGRERAAELHARGMTNRAIAKTIGVVEETVCRWLKEPAVQRRIAEIGDAAIHDARATLERAAGESARTLVKIQRGQGGKTAVLRLRAAESILSRVGIGTSERRELEHTVQGNAGAVQIALAIERRRKRDSGEGTT